MNEKDLNIEYICKKTLLNKGDELVPIILDLIQESYKAGLCQAEFDNTMDLIEENQELKEKLLVTQTNEETFRLEMEDITKILGLDEDTIFDDVKAYAKSLKDNMFEKEQLNSLVNSCQEEIRQLKKQNDSLKQKLNWIAFGDDSELALRYLRKIGYVDFDEERKVYINKHNNEPFLLKDEQEKDYYIKDNELNEYTEQLEYQIKELKKQLEEYQKELEKADSITQSCIFNGKEESKISYRKCLNILDKKETQQKEFIKYLEDKITSYKRRDSYMVADILGSYDLNNIELELVEEILQKYKEIIGDDK